MKKTPAKGHTRKHTGTRKHKATTKHHPVHHPKGATAHGHNVHTVAKHPTHAKARGLALADGVACCAAEALAASRRLAGGRVHDDDILALYEATACCHDSGAPILATLQAASDVGLGGVRLAGFAEEVLDHLPLPSGKRLRLWQEIDLGEGDYLIGKSPDHDASVILGAGFMSALNEQVIADFGDDPAVLHLGRRVDEHLLRRHAAQFETLDDFVADRPFAHALILGVDLPGPHAVAVDGRGRWWSWGRPWDPSDFPAAVIEEAWAVVWS